MKIMANFLKNRSAHIKSIIYIKNSNYTACLCCCMAEVDDGSMGK